MLLTKLSHSCIRLEKNGRTIAIDPGTFSETDQALAGVQAVLVTHEHADHIDQEAVVEALAQNPQLEVFAPQGVADTLRGAAADSADRIHTVTPGESFETAGFRVRCVGGQHALIHPSIPVVANVGYLIDDDVYHPGDALFVPAGVQVRTLLVPVHAPWSKVAEVVDFVVSIRADQAFQIHDALLNEAGLRLTENHVGRIGAEHGTRFRHLDSGESVDV